METKITSSLRGVKKNIYRGCELISTDTSNDHLTNSSLQECIVNDPVCILPPSGYSNTHRTKSMRVRPASASTVSEGNKRHDSMRSRPQSAHSDKKSVEKSPAVKQMEPFVYGYASNKCISNHDEDLSCDNSNNYPYKMCQIKVNGTEDSNKKDNEEDDPSLPMSLRPLRPWLLKAPETNSHGMDLTNCLVFLPPTALCQALPTVPSPQSATDPLPSYGCIEETPTKMITKNCSYPKPKTRKPITAWQCADGNKLKKVSSEIEIYSKEGNLIHRRYSGRRDAKIVRKEIAELEKLMKGIGAHDGISIVVRYQAEIKQLQDMLQETKPYIDQMESEDAFRSDGQEEEEEAVPADHFGLREFYKEHDKVMAMIIEEYKACLKELQEIESGLGIDSARKHFKQRYQQVTNQQPAS